MKLTETALIAFSIVYTLYTIHHDIDALIFLPFFHLYCIWSVWMYEKIDIKCIVCLNFFVEIGKIKMKIFIQTMLWIKKVCITTEFCARLKARNSFENSSRTLFCLQDTAQYIKLFQCTLERIIYLPHHEHLNFIIFYCHCYVYISHRLLHQNILQ